MVVLTSITQPTDGIRHRQPNTTVYVNGNNLGKGTLIIAESQLSWISDSGTGFAFEYPYISLHAISRDLTAFPQECLFLMLDVAFGGVESVEEDFNENNENGDADQETTELRLVPDDRGMLDAMFHAMNACQALHPDPDDSFSDEDFYEDADDELPIDEIDSRMANLPMESIAAEWAMDRLHFLTDSRESAGGRNQAGGIAADTDSAADRCTDSAADRCTGSAADRCTGSGTDRCTHSETDRCTERGLINRREQEWNRVAGRKKQEEDNMIVEADRVAGKVADKVVGKVAGRVVGRVEDRGVVVDNIEEEEDKVEDRGVVVDNIEEEEGMVEGISEKDMVVDREEGDMVVDSFEQDIVGQFDTVQGGRSFVRGNNQPQSNRARFPPATQSHTVLEEGSHFDDVEN